MPLRPLAFASLAALLLVTGPGCATLRSRAECERHGGEAWREVRTAHFRVRTPLPSAEARAAAVRLERFRRALAHAWGADFDPPGVTEVILLPDELALAEFRPRYLGWAMTRDTSQTLVLVARSSQGGTTDGTQVALHELSHQLAAHRLLRVPRWVNEGLAMYLERTLLVGEPPRVHVGELTPELQRRVAGGLVLPLEQLWAWAPRTAEDEGRLYASAGVWVHYLMNLEAPRFSAFQNALTAGAEPRAAWAEAFGDAPLDPLRVRRYAEGQQAYEMVSFTLPPVPEEAEERPLSAADVHLVRASLFTDGDGREGAEERARAEVGAALALAPESVEARAAAARLLGSRAERLAAARALASEHPRALAALKLLAGQLDGTPEQLREREGVLRRASHLAPEDPEVLVPLLLTYVQLERPAAALRHSRDVLRLAPWSVSGLQGVARVLAARGLCEDARRTQLRAADVAHDGTPEKVRAALRAEADRLTERCTPAAAGAP